jgi:hypothetical protein
MPSLALLLALPLSVFAAPTPELQTRQLSDSLNDVLNNLKDGINAGDIKQGILPDFFQNIPGTDEIRDRLGLNDTDIDALPLEVLNIPFVLPSRIVFFFFFATD